MLNREEIKNLPQLLPSATSSYAQRVFRAFVSVRSGSLQLTS